MVLFILYFTHSPIGLLTATKEEKQGSNLQEKDTRKKVGFYLSFLEHEQTYNMFKSIDYIILLVFFFLTETLGEQGWIGDGSCGVHGG